MRSQGEAAILNAKGLLDPYIEGSWNEKNFDSKLYYRNYQGKLVFPTQLGVNIIGGYENTDGVFLNPENKTDDLGLWNVGLEVDLLQGLINNERRIALEKARIFQDLNENEQRIALNELVYEASKVYYIWQLYQEYGNILQQNLTLSQDYLEATKAAFTNGEKTAMDTLEAYTLLQDAVLEVQKNNTVLIKARQAVENFLWYNDSPILLASGVLPESYRNPLQDIPTSIDSLDLSDHPVIRNYANKIMSAELDQILKREKLKPKLKAKYNSLLATREDIIPSLEISNFKWGLSLELPLRQRSDRAEIQLGEIKIATLGYDLEDKRNALGNKIQSSWMEQVVLNDQVSTLTQNVNNTRGLLEGENEKFRLGESSVFLLNKRQEKYIAAQMKLIETFTKMKLSRLDFLFFSNLLIL